MQGNNILKGKVKNGKRATNYVWRVELKHQQWGFEKTTRRSQKWNDDELIAIETHEREEAKSQFPHRSEGFSKGHFIPMRYGLGVWPDVRVVNSSSSPSASVGNSGLKYINFDFCSEISPIRFILSSEYRTNWRGPGLIQKLTHN